MAKLNLKAALSGAKDTNTELEEANTSKSMQVEPDAKSISEGGLANSISDDSSQSNKPTFKTRPMRNPNSKLVDIRTLIITDQARGIGIGIDEEHITQEEIETLASKIKGSNNGKVKSPILIQKIDDGDWLFDGETRVLACMYLAEAEHDDEFYIQPVQYVTLDELANDDIAEDLKNYRRFLMQANINGSGRDVSLKTKLALAEQGKNHGMTLDQIAQDLGMPNKGTVSRLLKISTYPASVQKMIFNGELPQSGAVFKKVLKEAEAAEQRELEVVEVAQAQISPDQEPGPVTSIEDDFAKEFESSTAPIESDQTTEVSMEPAKNEKESKPELNQNPDLSKVATQAKSDVKTKSLTVTYGEDELQKLYELLSYISQKHDLEIDLIQPSNRKEWKAMMSHVSNIIELLQGE